MECKKFTFKEKLSETRFLDDLDFNEEFKIYVDCPTSGGKSYYILNYLKEREIKAVFVVDTINLAKQLSAQYQIPYYTADHREDFNSSLIITIQHHIPKFESRETVIIDEAHTLVTEFGWKREVIEEVMISLEYYKRIIFLSGTPVTSDDSIFKGMTMIKAVKENPDKRDLRIVRYEDLGGGIIELCSFARKEKKIPVVSLLDKSSLLPKVLKALKEVGFKRIAIINSKTKITRNKGKEEEETGLVVESFGEGDDGSCYLSQLINQCRIDADVILTTYTQGYSLLGKDYLLIIAPGKNPHSFVNIVQMMNRFREDTTTLSYILTNAIIQKEGDKGIYNFPSIFDYLKTGITQKTRQRIEELNKVAKNTRTLKRQLKLLANECDQYISITREINHQSIAFKVFQLINHVMHEQLYKMSNILKYYNIGSYDDGYETNFKTGKEKRNKKNEEIMKEEILKEIDLFYKSRETESTMFMGKEFHLPKLGVKIEKNDIQNKIEDTYDELSCLGMQDKEIRELQEQHLHDTKRMNQIIKSQKIKLSTDPTLITYRVLLLKEFQVGEKLKGEEITERMNKLLIKNGMEQMRHNNAVQLFKLLFTTKTHVNKHRFYEILETF